jgi:hypothetical protein
MEKAVSNALLLYRYCPYCQAEVPVERRFPKAVLFLLTLAAVSLLFTALLYPRLIFLFIFLPFGFGLWRRAEHCAVCGRRLPSVKFQR